MSSTWQQRYLDRFYDRGKGFRDGTAEFHDLCAAHIPRGGRILEIGAGPSNPTSEFLAGIGELHGLDPDPDVRNNTALASASLLEGETYPFEDAAFDAAVSNYVIEHVPNPGAHLSEIHRVLRPGGVYIFRAPNLYHYVVAFSALTPHWIHVRLANRLRNLSEAAHDPYPTLYRMNTRRAVGRLAEEAGFEARQIRVVEKEPMYGMSSRVLFLTFTGYERLVNSTDLLQDLRSNLFCVLARR